MPQFALPSRCLPLIATVLAGLAATLSPTVPLAAFERIQAPPAPNADTGQVCPGLVASTTPRVVPAAMRLALNSDQARITYIGHSTFLLESPQLVRIATDYNDYVRSPVLPDVVTMNHAHSTH